MQTNHHSLGHLLALHDQELGRQIQGVLEDMTTEGSLYPPRWGTLERRLLDRIELEESYLLPDFDCVDPVNAADLHEEHAKLRYLLADMRVWLDSPIPRRQNVLALRDAVRKLSADKARTLYPWSDDLDSALASMILHRLTVHTEMANPLGA